MRESELSPDERRGILRDSLGVGLATGAYGVSFGAVSVASGLDVWQTCALSLLMFTGASQFAFVGVVSAGRRTSFSRVHCHHVGLPQRSLWSATGSLARLARAPAGFGSPSGH